MNYKKTVATAVLGFALASAPVHAGGMAEPMMEPEVISEEASGSGGYVIPLLLIALLVAVASSGGSSSPPLTE